MKNLILGNKKTFVLYLSIVISIFLISSYYYFLNNYKKLEDTNNNKYIQYLLTKIDNQYILFNKNSNKLIQIANSYEYLLKDSSMIDFFDTVEYKTEIQTYNTPSITIKSKYFKQIKLITLKKELISNYMSFYDNSNNLLFTVKTTNKREVVNTGKNTILIFMLIVFIFLLIVFIMVRQYYEAIKNNNELLEQKVNKRTSQIQSTLIELEKANLKLYDMAHTDFLTKVRNRRNFFIHSENFFSNAIRKNRDLSVIMIDIDNFKTFNDTFGHNAGDKILKEFSKCVENSLEEKDIFGRLGGEEFAISLFDVSLHDAIEKAEKIREAVESLEIIYNNQVLKLTASFGVSDIRGCKDIDQMLHKADTMLYSAKHGGKNRVRSRLSSNSK